MNYDYIMLVISDRVDLSDSMARYTASGYLAMRERYPKAQIHISVNGYDEDPRELWEIPEVCAYVRRWVELTGLTDWQHAVAQRWLDHRSTIGLLANCGAFGELTEDLVSQIKRALPQ